MSNDLTCPSCGKEGTKVIILAMPMKLCEGDVCGALWGEPWATIYTYIFAPIEMFFNGHCTFLAYDQTVGYWEALRVWIRGVDDNE